MMNKYDTVGIDCIAMVVNDILCVGAEPIALVDYLAVEKPDPERASEIAEGLVKGAEESRIAIIGGETASLPGIIKDFDLAGTGIGFVDIDKINVPFTAFVDQMTSLGKENRLEIHTMHEDIFNAMHRI